MKRAKKSFSFQLFARNSFSSCRGRAGREQLLRSVPGKEGGRERGLSLCGAASLSPGLPGERGLVLMDPPYEPYQSFMAWNLRLLQFLEAETERFSRDLPRWPAKM